MNGTLEFFSSHKSIPTRNKTLKSAYRRCLSNILDAKSTPDYVKNHVRSMEQQEMDEEKTNRVLEQKNPMKRHIDLEHEKIASKKAAIEDCSNEFSSPASPIN
ncbi:hypothetical protein VTP01DRAFT_8124 [Rhizomucor pusillus]|uniref:uncharacterized protein n=1 Tax=Rhizomucor pusillus TaxID=4840 RepID=UPI00374414B0